MWNFYFFLKYYLFYKSIIQIHFLLNLLLLIFLIIPVPEGFKKRSELNAIKLVVSLFLALLLLWYDSWLPSFKKVLDFIFDEGIPLKEYLIQFSHGFLNLMEMTIIGAILLICFIAYRKEIRITPISLILLLTVPLQSYHHEFSDKSDRARAQIFDADLKKSIHFVGPVINGDGEDIMILHVCSLSWDDLKEVGLDKDPFFNQYDILMTQFNGVTSYSGPSAIRLLRANCGQVPHQSLYQNVPEECYLFSALQSVGFTENAIMNHDGVYGHFSKEIQELGHLVSPQIPSDLPVQAYNFDGSAIYDDFAVLDKWWKERQENPSRQVAVYYNTISLHDGAHFKDENEWWKHDRKERYRSAVSKLFSDLERFYQLVESTNRRGIILFVPEHGMALRGSRIQVAGLREIPLPQITTVPVGIKYFGIKKSHRDIQPLIVSKPVSYLALSFLISQFIKTGLNDTDASQIPETDFMSENDGAKVVKYEGEFYINAKDKQWKKLTSEQMN
ncbi:MAG: cellulose biosynthesis protein BcsG [Nitrospirae bacterium]|nr:cellulose biosynthesis protein BcsG [Nitrospirota bacterium]